MNANTRSALFAAYVPRGSPECSRYMCAAKRPRGERFREPRKGVNSEARNRSIYESSIRSSNNMQLIRTLILAAALLVGRSLLADTRVNGYYRKDGTYVEQHWRSNPNSTTSDNWSTRGNANPYTGQFGTRDGPFTEPRLHCVYRPEQ